MNHPYEYIDGKLGVQSRYLVSGRDAHTQSLQLISDRGLRKKIDRGQVIRLRMRGHNTPALVQFDTLPDAWQKQVIAMWGNPPAKVKQSLFEEHYNRDAAAFDFYTGYMFPHNNKPLDDEYVEQYTLNASVLNTIGKIYAKRYALRKELRQEVRGIWGILRNETLRFKATVSHTLPENESRLRQTYNRYKKEGYASLISKKHGNNNARIVTDDTEKLLNNMFAGQSTKPNPAEVHEQYNAFLDGYVEIINETTGELYNPKEFKALSEATVRNYLTKWSNQIGTHAKRSGDRQKYMARFKPYHSLEHPEYAGSIISVDDRQPPFEYAKNTRMWFYNGIDLGSEAFTCWVYGKSKEGIILDFYRQMVRNYAQWNLPLPAELEGELNLNASFMDTFLKEGNMFQYVRIEANNARGKRIEQYYKPLRYQYEKKREGWLPRPFAIQEANQIGPNSKKLIPYDEIVEGCLRDIETWNNSPHSVIKNKSRWDVFLAMQNPATRPTNYRGILPYLGYRTETSVNAGIIRFRNTEFLLGQDGVIAVGERLIRLMEFCENKNITICWLDDNYGGVLKAYIYIGTQFICEAVKKPRYNKARIEQTPEDIINRELMSKYVATIEGFGRGQRKQLDKVTVIGSRPATIGNSFVMPGLHKPVFEEEEAPVLAGFEKEFDLNPVETTFNRGIRDTY